MNLNLDLVRSHFPSLDTDWVFFDNGGGSQIAQPVVDRIGEYLLTSNVQHGASYEISQLAEERVTAAQQAMATLINARDASEVIMAGSTSLLLQRLATAFSRKLSPGDEVIVSSGDHEANISPWLELERVGVEIKFWHLNPETFQLDIGDLNDLMTTRTKLVAVTHTSNILGTINPIRQIADVVHARGGLLCVDGVGYAPHRAVDVQALDADFYAFSFYKVYGPHYALLYGKQELLVDLPSRSFFFIEEDDVPYKFQPGGPNYELSYGMLGLMDYLDELAGITNERHSRRAVESSFSMMSEHEELLSSSLLEFLTSKPGIRIIGSEVADRNVRVPIISFVVDSARSSEVVERVDPFRVAIRYGHFYSARLIERLGLFEKDGVVRVSMVHYNSPEEVDRLISALEIVLPR